MYGSLGRSTRVPRGFAELVSHAMSAVAVVVSSTAGRAVIAEANPSGNPPGTQASHASGVSVPGEGGAAVTDGLGGSVWPVPLSSRPDAKTTAEPTKSTTAKAATPRITALRVRSSMDMRRRRV
jgi:hypothetical protein